MDAADASWARFFGTARLAPQLARARKNGHVALYAKGEKLLQALPQLSGEADAGPKYAALLRLIASQLPQMGVFL
jgi:fructosamine-3-kinase